MSPVSNRVSLESGMPAVSIIPSATLRITPAAGYHDRLAGESALRESFVQWALRPVRDRRRKLGATFTICTR